MRAIVVTAAIVAALVSSTSAQFQGRFRGRMNYGLPPNAKYDGAFTFCRIMFRQAPDGDGGNWAVDYPRADVNLSFRLSELTTTSVAAPPAGTSITSSSG